MDTTHNGLTDIDVARKYLALANRAINDGTEFELSFTAYKNMVRAKYCKFTGIVMSDTQHTQHESYRTIDRIDNKKGYISGNVCACSYMANQLKARFENPVLILKPEHAIAIALEVIKVRDARTI